MEKEKYETSEYMKQFFKNLQELKLFIKEKAEEKNDDLLKEIYERFDKTFKVED